ncbi:hypothetical protein BBP40_008333 [Aspergillus hancockii]|nr:hypothetical protein BBP40_008333 [Aspergillus hancockii]
MFLKAGAVLYIKTSVPQSLMGCETVNNIYGRTTNPRNKDWSCGGRFGGECALLALRGSVLGVGTDIGDSIRVPAAFISLYGLRHSHGRLPYAKIANNMEGQDTIHSDHLPPLTGSSHPPVLRAAQIVFNKLREARHTVLPWEPCKHAHDVNLANRIFASDGGTDMFGVLRASGEPAIPNIKDLVNPNLPKMNVNELWDVQLQKWDYQCEYLSRIRELGGKLGKELDVIIAPITPTAAIRHNQFRYYGYASAANILDYTSVVVPVTFADKDISIKNEEFKPLTNIDKVVQAEYNPAGYHGAPVAVQIIGRRLTEERVLSIAEEVGSLLGNEVTE